MSNHPGSSGVFSANAFAGPSTAAERVKMTKRRIIEEDAEEDAADQGEGTPMEMNDDTAPRAPEDAEYTVDAIIFARYQRQTDPATKGRACWHYGIQWHNWTNKAAALEPDGNAPIPASLFSRGSFVQEFWDAIGKKADPSPHPKNHPREPKGHIGYTEECQTPLPLLIKWWQSARRAYRRDRQVAEEVMASLGHSNSALLADVGRAKWWAKRAKHEIKRLKSECKRQQMPLLEEVLSDEEDIERDIQDRLEEILAEEEEERQEAGKIKKPVKGKGKGKDKDIEKTSKGKGKGKGGAQTALDIGTPVPEKKGKGIKRKRQIIDPDDEEEPLATSLAPSIPSIRNAEAGSSKSTLSIDKAASTADPDAPPKKKKKKLILEEPVVKAKAKPKKLKANRVITPATPTVAGQMHNQQQAAALPAAPGEETGQASNGSGTAQKMQEGLFSAEDELTGGAQSSRAIAPPTSAAPAQKTFRPIWEKHASSSAAPVLAEAEKKQDEGENLTMTGLLSMGNTAGRNTEEPSAETPAVVEPSMNTLAVQPKEPAVVPTDKEKQPAVGASRKKQDGGTAPVAQPNTAAAVPSMKSAEVAASKQQQATASVTKPAPKLPATIDMEVDDIFSEEGDAPETAAPLVRRVSVAAEAPRPMVSAKTPAAPSPSATAIAVTGAARSDIDAVSAVAQEPAAVTVPTSTPLAASASASPPIRVAAPAVQSVGAATVQASTSLVPQTMAASSNNGASSSLLAAPASDVSMMGATPLVTGPILRHQIRGSISARTLVCMRLHGMKKDASIGLWALETGAVDRHGEDLIKGRYPWGVRTTTSIEHIFNASTAAAMFASKRVLGFAQVSVATVGSRVAQNNKALHQFISQLQSAEFGDGIGYARCTDAMAIVFFSTATELGDLFGMPSVYRTAHGITGVFLEMRDLDPKPPGAIGQCRNVKKTFSHLGPRDLIEDTLLASFGFTKQFFTERSGKEIAVIGNIAQGELQRAILAGGAVPAQGLSPGLHTVLVESQMLQYMRGLRGLREMVTHGIDFYAYGHQSDASNWGPQRILTMKGGLVAITPSALLDDLAGSLSLAQTIKALGSGWKAYILPQTLVWLDQALGRGVFPSSNLPKMMVLLQHIDVLFMLPHGSRDRVKRLQAIQALQAAGPLAEQILVAKQNIEVGFSVMDVQNLQKGTNEEQMKVVAIKQLQDLHCRGLILHDYRYPRLVAVLSDAEMAAKFPGTECLTSAQATKLLVHAGRE